MCDDFTAQVDDDGPMGGVLVMVEVSSVVAMT
jgi:hypothetical protein